MAARSPHIFIKGLITSGGIFTFFFPPAWAGLDQISLSNKIVYRKTIRTGLLSSSNALTKDSETNTSIAKAPRPPMELNILSDRQSYDARRKLFIAEGNVSLNLNQAILKADRVEFDRSFKTLYAKGKVRFIKGSQYFQASNFRYNLIHKKGQLNDVYGVVDLENLNKDLKELIEGKKINKKNPINQLEDINNRSINSQRSSKNDSFKDQNSSLDFANFHLNNQAPFVNIENQRLISCPPLLPQIPDWHPYSWSLTTWGGQMTNAAIGEALFFSNDFRKETLLGFGINKRIARSGPFSFELEADWLFHKSQTEGKVLGQEFHEMIIGFGPRVWLRPWLNLGLIEGLSLHSSLSNYEGKRPKHSKLLNYLGFEVEALLSEQLSLVGRIHHRSGAWGTFAGVTKGSNAYLLGFRYRWGRENLLKEDINLLPPIGCPGSQESTRNIPKVIDDRLEMILKGGFDSSKHFTSYEHLEKHLHFENKLDVLGSKSSKLSKKQQEKVRDDLISLIDQRITQIKYRDRFSISGQIGITESSESIDLKDRPAKARIAQLDRYRQSKFITGSITHWRVQAKKIQILPNGWKTNRISFTNDPFTPTQTRIEARNVVASEELNGDMLIKSDRSILVIEERMRLPIVNSRRIRKGDRIKNRWIVGADFKDRDGIFIGREMEPIKLGKQYSLTLQPQFLIQRSIINETNSYIKPGSSVTSSKARNSINTADLFGIKGKLRGKTYDWDVRLDANISTFDTKKIANGSRYWTSLKKDFDVPLINRIATSFFAAYRYKVWNGSLGETNIYTAYGGYVEKNGNWNWNNLQNSYLIRIGSGNYQAERSEGESLVSLWRGNIYGEWNSKYPILVKDSPGLKLTETYRYSPVPINSGITLNTRFSMAYFTYEDGSYQNALSFSTGPTFTLGNFSKKYLDYTKLSIFGGGTLKQGSSPFAFDRIVDLATLGLGLTQQIAGPLVLNTGFEFNIDKSSEYYGKPINSKIELSWQRRSYNFSIFYSPEQGVGGLNFRLNDFDFSGIGVPFVPYKPLDRQIEGLQ